MSITGDLRVLRLDPVTAPQPWTFFVTFTLQEGGPVHRECRGLLAVGDLLRVAGIGAPALGAALDRLERHGRVEIQNVTLNHRQLRMMKL